MRRTSNATTLPHIYNYLSGNGTTLCGRHMHAQAGDQCADYYVLYMDILQQDSFGNVNTDKSSTQLDSKT